MTPKTGEALCVLIGGLWTVMGLGLVYGGRGYQKEGAVILVSGATLAAFVAAIRTASS